MNDTTVAPKVEISNDAINKEKVYDNYALSFNKLAGMLETSNIDIQLLKNVIKAAITADRLNIDINIE